MQCMHSLLSHRIGCMRARCMLVFMPPCYFLSERTSWQLSLLYGGRRDGAESRLDWWTASEILFGSCSCSFSSLRNFCTARRWQRRVYLFILIYCPWSCVFLQNHCLHREKTPSIRWHTHASRGEFNLHVSIKEIKPFFFYPSHPKLPWFKTQTKSACRETAKRWNYTLLFYEVYLQ